MRRDPCTAYHTTGNTTFPCMKDANHKGPHRTFFGVEWRDELS